MKHSGRLIVSLSLGSAILACASPGWPPLIGPSREQPTALAGRWTRDVDGASRTDGVSSQILVLLPNGHQWTERATDDPRGDEVRTSPSAWWWVYAGTGADSARLCLHWRAGRHGADCSAFQFDTVRRDGQPLPRLHWGHDVFVAAR